jgi:hypothetical protein
VPAAGLVELSLIALVHPEFRDELTEAAMLQYLIWATAVCSVFSTGFSQLQNLRQSLLKSPSY